MATRDVRVLHVLPHPGGGGETYVRALEALPGYSVTRVFVAPSPRARGAIGPFARSLVRITREARRHDLLHVHGEVAGGLCLPVLVGRPSVVTLHGLNLLRRAAGVRSVIARANLHAVIRGADRTICVSEGELDEVKAVSPKLTERCTVIPNGVAVPPQPTEAERRTAREALGVGDGTVLALWVGGLYVPKQPRVAVEAAVDAARRGAPLRLAVVGDGPLRQAAEVAASEQAVVTFHGHREDVRPFMAAADVFVLASEREGLPFAMLEAMAIGLVPVVAAGAGTEAVVAGAGFGVRQGDRRSLADALLAVAGSADLRARYGRAARARVAEHFTLEQMLGGTQRLYEHVLGEREVR